LSRGSGRICSIISANRTEKKLIGPPMITSAPCAAVLAPAGAQQRPCGRCQRKK
jgi:hypothetical protein